MFLLFAAPVGLEVYMELSHKLDPRDLNTSFKQLAYRDIRVAGSWANNNAPKDVHRHQVRLHVVTKDISHRTDE